MNTGKLHQANLLPAAFTGSGFVHETIEAAIWAAEIRAPLIQVLVTVSTPHGYSAEATNRRRANFLAFGVARALEAALLRVATARPSDPVVRVYGEHEDRHPDDDRDRGPTAGTATVSISYPPTDENERRVFLDLVDAVIERMFFAGYQSTRPVEEVLYTYQEIQKR